MSPVSDHRRSDPELLFAALGDAQRSMASVVRSYGVDRDVFRERVGVALRRESSEAQAPADRMDAVALRALARARQFQAIALMLEARLIDGGVIETPGDSQGVIERGE